VEGLLEGISSDLKAAAMNQWAEGDAEVAAKIQAVVLKLEHWRAGTNLPFEIVVDDISGNSWVEPAPGDAPGKLVRAEYVRSREQNVKLGLVAEDEATEENETENGVSDGGASGTEYRPQHMEPAMPEGPTTNNVDDEDIVENQVYQFHDSCPACMQPCTTNMKMVNIPHFQQVVIMSTVCDHCGCEHPLSFSNPSDRQL
jgi:zinc finger protein